MDFDNVEVRSVENELIVQHFFSIYSLLGKFHSSRRMYNKYVTLLQRYLCMYVSLPVKVCGVS